MLRKIIFAALLLFLLIGSCIAQENFLHRWNRTITEAMVTDGFSPVLASRTYVYPNIAAYLILENQYESLPRLEYILQNRVMFDDSIYYRHLNFELAAITAFYHVSKQLIYREATCDSLYQWELKRLAKGDTALWCKSMDAGNYIGKIILQWAARDRYAQTKAKPAYIPYTGLQYWKPTPPEYRDALEAYWGTVQPISMDSSLQFFVMPTIVFDTARSSAFYKQAKEVYDITAHLTPAQKAIALFWDDNPDLNTFVGHVPTPRRYLSPPAHWMNIVAQITRLRHSDIATTAQAMTYTAIVMEDSKIAVWEAKYMINLIRPVTYIRSYIATDWMPLLVTPPFPEYPSGHSACSMSAAVVLTHLFGDTLSFTDSSLVQYHIAPRHFTSFIQAADEVSESRIYGGIHYRSGVVVGREMGRKIGTHFIKKLKK